MRIKQHCKKCERWFYASGRFVWCWYCYKNDPDGAKEATGRGNRIGWINQLGRMERHEPIVYAIYLGDGRVKVGTTTCIKKRLGEYRTIVPHASAFWATRGDARVESRYHDALDKYRIEREVFQLGDMHESLVRLEVAQRAVEKIH